MVVRREEKSLNEFKFHDSCLSALKRPVVFLFSNSSINFSLSLSLIIILWTLPGILLSRSYLLFIDHCHYYLFRFLNFRMTLSAILLLVILGTCIDILEQLDKAEVVSGEVTQVGYLERRGSRLSRFRNSLMYHWNRMGGPDYKRIQRRNTIGQCSPSVNDFDWLVVLYQKQG